MNTMFVLRRSMRHMCPLWSGKNLSMRTSCEVDVGAWQRAAHVACQKSVTLQTQLAGVGDHRTDMTIRH